MLVINIGHKYFSYTIRVCLKALKYEKKYFISYYIILLIKSGVEFVELRGSKSPIIWINNVHT